MNTNKLLILLLLIQSSCWLNTKNRGDKTYTTNSNDSCKVLISTFNYPDDLNRLDGFNYLCQDTLLTILRRKDLNLTHWFSDKNYSSFNYDFRTTLIFDKRKALLLCFKRSVDSDRFTKMSTESIYFLDYNFMPQYVIRRDIYKQSESYIEKFFYDNKFPELYSYVIKLRNNNRFELRELNYSDIVKIANNLKSGEYVQTDKRYSYESPHFKMTPYWVEN